MEKNVFIGLEEEKKKTKLKNVLKTRTYGFLTDSELDIAIQGIKLNRQYSIRLFFKAKEFQKAITLSTMSKGKVVFGCVRLIKGREGVLEDETMPALVTIVHRAKTLENHIFIYIPQNRTQKKKHYEGVQEPMVLCDRECVKEKRICSHIRYGKTKLYCDLIAN